MRALFEIGSFFAGMAFGYYILVPAEQYLRARRTMRRLRRNGF